MLVEDRSDVVKNTLAYNNAELIMTFLDTAPAGFHSGRLQPCLRILDQDRSDVVTNTLAYNSAELITARYEILFIQGSTQVGSSLACKC
jgi:hypothetical protein